MYLLKKFGNAGRLWNTSCNGTQFHQTGTVPASSVDFKKLSGNSSTMAAKDGSFSFDFGALIMIYWKMNWLIGNPG